MLGGDLRATETLDYRLVDVDVSTVGQTLGEVKT